MKKYNGTHPPSPVVNIKSNAKDVNHEVDLRENVFQKFRSQYRSGSTEQNLHLLKVVGIIGIVIASVPLLPVLILFWGIGKFVLIKRVSKTKKMSHEELICERKEALKDYISNYRNFDLIDDELDYDFHVSFNKIFFLSLILDVPLEIALKLDKDFKEIGIDVLPNTDFWEMESSLNFQMSVRPSRIICTHSRNMGSTRTTEGLLNVKNGMSLWKTVEGFEVPFREDSQKFLNYIKSKNENLYEIALRRLNCFYLSIDSNEIKISTDRFSGEHYNFPLAIIFNCLQSIYSSGIKLNFRIDEFKELADLGGDVKWEVYQPFSSKKNELQELITKEILLKKYENKLLELLEKYKNESFPNTDELDEFFLLKMQYLLLAKHEIALIQDDEGSFIRSEMGSIGIYAKKHKHDSSKIKHQFNILLRDYEKAKN